MALKELVIVLSISFVVFYGLDAVRGPVNAFAAEDVHANEMARLGRLRMQSEGLEYADVVPIPE